MQVCVLTQSCQTLPDPMDCSLPVSFVHGIIQARILEWVAISFLFSCYKSGIIRNNSQRKLRRQLSIMWDPGLDSKLEEERHWKIAETQMRSIALFVNGNIPLLISWQIIVLWLCKKLMVKAG